jgi:hypothetical protein
LKESGVIPIFGRGPALLGWLEKESGFVYDRYMQPRAFVRGEYVFAFPGKGFIAVFQAGVFLNRSMKVVGFIPGAKAADVAPKPLSTPPTPLAPQTPRPPQQPPAPQTPSLPAGIQALARFELLEDGY